MQYFSFHRASEQLRSRTLMFRVMISFDFLGCATIGFIFVPGPPDTYFYMLFLLLIGPLPFWIVGAPLRRRHSLTEETLTLASGYFQAFPIPRDQVVSIERYTQGLPKGLNPIATKYSPRLDTLFVLPGKKNLVQLTLKSPVTGKMDSRHSVEFTKAVFVADDPEALIAAMAPHANQGQPQSQEPQGERLSAVSYGSNPADGSTAIELRALTKRFGSYTAVDELSLQVAPGEIFAFLGSNGAGKSTTVKMLVGLLRPTSGRILIGGKDPWQELNARRQVGYVPDSPMLYENLTAQEHLWLIGGLYDIDEPQARIRAIALLTQLGLERSADQQIRSFSLGMKRKLAIASALMHQPSVLVLDEATNGLDPRATRDIKDFIAAAARGGMTVFLTTHLLDVVSELAHRVAIIDQGRLQALGTVEELGRAVGRPGASLEELFLLATDRSGQGVSA